MSTSAPGAPSPLAQLRVTVSAGISGVLVIVLAVYFVLGDSLGDPVPLTSVVVVVVIGVADAAALSLLGYRMPAIAPGTDRDAAVEASRRAYTSSTFVRMALSEAVAIISLGLAFLVTDGGYVVLLLGALISVVLMAVHAWPGQRTLAKAQESLERDGGQSYLREAMGA